MPEESASEAFVPPATRTELLQRRKAETHEALRLTHSAWEMVNPMWAPQLTGPAAAAALGYVSGQGQRTGHATRRELLLARKIAGREAAISSSGFADAAGPRQGAEPAGMITSLARPNAKEPSLAWVEAPPHPTRSELMHERARLEREDLEAQAQAHVERGQLDTNGRVAQRVAESVAYIREAPKGESRAALLAARKEARVRESEAAAAAVGVAYVPRFSEQPKPFWHVGPQGEAAAARGAGGSSSFEDMQATRRWYARPEVYPKVGPPRREEPFKLTADDKVFLCRKLSSGPKKAQRGYPREAGELCGKVTAGPAPPLPKAAEKDVKKGGGNRRFTDSVFRFLAEEENMKGESATESVGDGLRFTAPLYSSFTKSGVFSPPRLPHPAVQRVRASKTRGAYRPPAEPAAAERAESWAARTDARAETRPFTTTGCSRMGNSLRPAAQPPSAPAGMTGGLGATSASERSFADSASASLRMSALLTRKERPASGAPLVRSGGFKLAPRAASAGAHR